MWPVSMEKQSRGVSPQAVRSPVHCEDPWFRLPTLNEDTPAHQLRLFLVLSGWLLSAVLPTISLHKCLPSPQYLHLRIRSAELHPWVGMGMKWETPTHPSMQTRGSRASEAWVLLTICALLFPFCFLRTDSMLQGDQGPSKIAS